ncbi:MAG: VOC family protein [Actinomycetota bacterium]|jgi:predicted enzyme related to lactoylglutathione lyase
MVPGALGEIRFVTVDSRDPERLAEFWSRVLGVDVEERFGDGYVILSRPVDGAPRVTFQAVPEEKAGKNRMHFDLKVANIEDATRELEELGAMRTLDGDFEEQGYRWRVMRDPEGNEFCIALMPD